MIDLAPSAISTRRQKPTSPLEKRFKPKPAIHRWIDDLNKWISIIERWEKESDLLLKLAYLAITGEEGLVPLGIAADKFKKTVEGEIHGLKFQFLDMLTKVERMDHFGLLYARKMQDCKSAMQKVAMRYDSLKHKILEGMVETYPIVIV